MKMRFYKKMLGVGCLLALSSAAGAQVIRGPFPERAAFSSLDLLRACKDAEPDALGTWHLVINERGDVAFNAIVRGRRMRGLFRLSAASGECKQIKPIAEMAQRFGSQARPGSLLSITDDGTLITNTSSLSGEATGIVRPDNDREEVLRTIAGQPDEYSTTAVSPMGRIAGGGRTGLSVITFLRDLTGETAIIPKFRGRDITIFDIADSGFLIGAYAGRRGDGNEGDRPVGITRNGEFRELRLPSELRKAEFDYSSYANKVNRRGQVLTQAFSRENDRYLNIGVKFDLSTRASAPLVMPGDAVDLNECGSVLSNVYDSAGMSVFPTVYADSGAPIDVSRGLLTNDPTVEKRFLTWVYRMNSNHQIIGLTSGVDSIGYVTGEARLVLLTPTEGSTLAGISCNGERVTRARSVSSIGAALKRSISKRNRKSRR
jgi:hypothetical protein